MSEEEAKLAEDTASVETSAEANPVKKEVTAEDLLKVIWTELKFVVPKVAKTLPVAL